MTPALNQSKEFQKTAGSFSRADRFKFWIVSLLGYWIIRIIGSTIRWRAEGIEVMASHSPGAGRNIYAFWHGRLFMAMYYLRNRGIVVMTSGSRDGEFIMGVCRRFGYGAARGSSSRGGSRALAEMMRKLRSNEVILTIDGPRGPRYVAKPGAVWLAAQTGSPVIPFCISAEKKWTLSSWDLFQIPKPFTRAVLLMGRPIYVAKQAGEQHIEDARKQLQASLDDLRERCDSYWDKQASR